MSYIDYTKKELKTEKVSDEKQHIKKMKGRSFSRGIYSHKALIHLCVQTE